MFGSLPETYQYHRHELASVRDLIALAFLSRWYLGLLWSNIWEPLLVFKADTGFLGQEYPITEYWSSHQLSPSGFLMQTLNRVSILLYSCWFLKFLIYLLSLYISLLLWDDLDLSSPILFNDYLLVLKKKKKTNLSISNFYINVIFTNYNDFISKNTFY